MIALIITTILRRVHIINLFSEYFSGTSSYLSVLSPPPLSPSPPPLPSSDPVLKYPQFVFPQEKMLGVSNNKMFLQVEDIQMAGNVEDVRNGSLPRGVANLRCRLIMAAAEAEYCQRERRFRSKGQIRENCCVGNVL